MTNHYAPPSPSSWVDVTNGQYPNSREEGDSECSSNSLDDNINLNFGLLDKGSKKKIPLMFSLFHNILS